MTDKQKFSIDAISTWNGLYFNGRDIQTWLTGIAEEYDERDEVVAAKVTRTIRNSIRDLH